MSAWESLEALRAFAYGDELHVAVRRRRREWFARLGEMHAVLWWIAAGSLPTIAEAEERLTELRAYGPSPTAFTFREHFAPPSGTADDAALSERDLSPAD
jgi:hypothetical protein